jgi:hypothetical protein
MTSWQDERWKTAGSRLPKHAQALLKAINFPGGSGRSDTNDEASWSKRGGYADKQTKALLSLALRHGFKQKTFKDNIHQPDNVSSETVYADKHGNELRMYDFIGTTKHDNSYSFKLKFSPEYLKSSVAPELEWSKEEKAKIDWNVVYYFVDQDKLPGTVPAKPKKKAGPKPNQDTWFIPEHTIIGDPEYEDDDEPRTAKQVRDRFKYVSQSHGDFKVSPVKAVRGGWQVVLTYVSTGKPKKRKRR